MISSVITLVAPQGEGMAERNAKRLQDAQAQLHQYIRDTAGSSGP